MKWSTKIVSASSGNRTRAARVAGEHSTTEPTMLIYNEWIYTYKSSTFAVTFTREQLSACGGGGGGGMDEGGKRNLQKVPDVSKRKPSWFAFSLVEHNYCTVYSVYDIR